MQSAPMTEEEKSETSAGNVPEDNPEEAKDRSNKSITSEKEVAQRTSHRLSREAKALRDNLRKRKGQLRERK